MIQGDELDKLGKETRELKEERATLICEAEEKDERIIRCAAAPGGGGRAALHCERLRARARFPRAPECDTHSA